MEKFRQRLKELREAEGLTHKEFAKRVYLSEYSIYNYESGTTIPRADIIVIIADCFNVSADSLLGISDRKERL